MSIAKFITGTALVAVASFAYATPEYSDSLYADFPAALDEGSSTSAIDGALNNGTQGYYIWNSSAKDWHIRWSSKSSDRYYFAGAFTLFNGKIDSKVNFSFENGNSDYARLNNGITKADVEWTSLTTNGWDGVDISLQDAFTFGNEIRLDLYSNIWDLSGFTGGQGSNGGLKGTDIFLGTDFATPNVEILGDLTVGFGNNNVTMRGQAFEVTVPEPGTIALLGLGLAGLGAARRRQKA